MLLSPDFPSSSIRMATVDENTSPMASNRSYEKRSSLGKNSLRSSAKKGIRNVIHSTSTRKSMEKSELGDSGVKSTFSMPKISYPTGRGRIVGRYSDVSELSDASEVSNDNDTDNLLALVNDLNETEALVKNGPQSPLPPSKQQSVSDGMEMLSDLLQERDNTQLLDGRVSTGSCPMSVASEAASRSAENQNVSPVSSKDASDVASAAKNTDVSAHGVVVNFFGALVDTPSTQGASRYSTRLSGRCSDVSEMTSASPAHSVSTPVSSRRTSLRSSRATPSPAAAGSAKSVRSTRTARSDKSPAPSSTRSTRSASKSTTKDISVAAAVLPQTPESTRSTRSASTSQSARSTRSARSPAKALASPAAEVTASPKANGTPMSAASTRSTRSSTRSAPKAEAAAVERSGAVAVAVAQAQEEEEDEIDGNGNEQDIDADADVTLDERGSWSTLIAADVSDDVSTGSDRRTTADTQTLRAVLDALDADGETETLTLTSAAARTLTRVVARASSTRTGTHVSRGFAPDIETANRRETVDPSDFAGMLQGLEDSERSPQLDGRESLDTVALMASVEELLHCSSDDDDHEKDKEGATPVEEEEHVEVPPSALKSCLSSRRAGGGWGPVWSVSVPHPRVLCGSAAPRVLCGLCGSAHTPGCCVVCVAVPARTPGVLCGLGGNAAPFGSVWSVWQCRPCGCCVVCVAVPLGIGGVVAAPGTEVPSVSGEIPATPTDTRGPKNRALVRSVHSPTCLAPGFISRGLKGSSLSV